MGEGGGVSCVKCIMMFCNILFGLTGLLILTIGAIVQTNYSHYSNFVGDTVWTAPIILIIIGVVVFTIGFLGCCGAWKESSCMILTFAGLIFLIFLSEIAIGIAGYVKHGELNGILQRQFNYTLEKYNDRQDFRDTWKMAQSELNCCGAQGPNDWKQVFPNGDLPPSCCVEINWDESKVCTAAHSHQEGCLNKLLTILDSNTLVLGAAVLSVVFIQLLTIFYACYLFRTFRQRYETV